MLFYQSFEDYLSGERRRLEALARVKMPDSGRITRVLSSAPASDGAAPVYPTTREVEALEVDALGVIGDRHRGALRPSTGRERTLYPKGTTIRQHRHLCVVSSHDCRALTERLGVEITPELLGADLVIDASDGAPFSMADMPPGVHLLIYPPGLDEVPSPPAVTLIHQVKQRGCGITGKAIADHYGDKSLTSAFRKISVDNRASICSVEHPADATAFLRAGQQVAFRYAMGVTP